MATVTDNIEQIAKQTDELVKQYETTVPQDLKKLVNEIQRELKAGKYKNKTGDLRRSISAKLIDYNITVQQLVYGYFISFGVEGGKYKALGLPDEVASLFGTKKFKSRKRKNWGIRPRNFYPDDIEQEIIDILTEE